MKKKWIIGTRGSKLALTQTQIVVHELRSHYPAHEFVIKTIKTTGDTVWNKPLHLVGGKGLFVKEIEEQLLEGSIDMAVHSVKDLPAQLEKGLILGAVLKRENPRDAFVSLTHDSLDKLEAGSRIGTSSLRRRAQLLHYNSALKIVTLRGNIDTRIKKLKTEALDAVILAYAGLTRMGLEDCVKEILPFSVMIPACGQGAIGIEVKDREETREFLRPVSHERSFQEISIERQLLAQIGGGCHLPLGIHAAIEGDVVTLSVSMGTEDGRLFVHEQHSARTKNTDTLIREAYEAIRESLP
ncbi:MAG TPA: hydroxymethylbilane synthase [Syntrophorhabdaceae bacterium]|nr:hydroxymethylbilane synthase [Syntrophorhabdaceae bacterium]